MPGGSSEAKTARRPRGGGARRGCARPRGGARPPPSRPAPSAATSWAAASAACGRSRSPSRLASARSVSSAGRRRAAEIVAQEPDGAIEHRPAPRLIARPIEKLRQRADRRDVARRLVDGAPQLGAGAAQIAGVHQDLAERTRVFWRRAASGSRATSRSVTGSARFQSPSATVEVGERAQRLQVVGVDREHPLVRGRRALRIGDAVEVDLAEPQEDRRAASPDRARPPRAAGRSRRRRPRPRRPSSSSDRRSRARACSGCLRSTASSSSRAADPIAELAGQEIGAREPERGDLEGIVRHLDPRGRAPPPAPARRPARRAARAAARTPRRAPDRSPAPRAEGRAPAPARADSPPAPAQPPASARAPGAPAPASRPPPSRDAPLVAALSALRAARDAQARTRRGQEGRLGASAARQLSSAAAGSSPTPPRAARAPPAPPRRSGNRPRRRRAASSPR